MRLTSQLFLSNFSENYQFVKQDEVQGFPWNNFQCTLLPFVTYYQENDELKNISYCVISNDGKHDAALVYEVQKTILADLKYRPLRLSTIIYFTDGYAGKYENWKICYNLCKYRSDFGLNARRVFFATSLSKQLCDRIGGTVKWLVSNGSEKCDLKD